MRQQVHKICNFLRKSSLIVAPNFVHFAFVIHGLVCCKNNIVGEEYRNSLHQLGSSQENENYTNSFNRENLT